ncbi:MAG TPA: MMPL family transporter [Streptosporangiaceae bacterium]
MGQAETGRVITAAATIMILVFLSFLFEQQLIIDQFGVGLAGAVIVDAFLIRTVLVPAAMHLSGNANWWLPRWLDRVLPRLSVDLPGPPPPAAPAGLTGPDAVPADTTAP